MELLGRNLSSNFGEIWLTLVYLQNLIMFHFFDIPPNRTVVQSSNQTSANRVYGPGLSQTKLTIDVKTETQKTRADVLLEAKQSVVNGKKTTKTTHIVTRNFTVRQEIVSGKLYQYSYCIAIYFFSEYEEDAEDDHYTFRKHKSNDKNDPKANFVNVVKD